MAISYVSEVIRANPWVQPFDIDLMAKVNSYKQGEFYKNAAKVENMITQLNNADIANPEQREYLKGKVNNLTTQLNNIGAINYSDLNVANTIEGFGSEIYGDEKVLNGIMSTKSIREWQSNVQKMKTDPKLNKFYNGANEAYDYEHHIKPYVQGGIEAKYEGPRAPKPYTGNPFAKVMKALKDVRPDIETRIDPVTNNPFFFSRTENKRLTPEDISAAVDGFIDGDTKQQLQIDAWYNYDYSTGNKFTKQTGLDIYTQDLDNALDNKKSELDAINDQLAAEPDVNKKAEWEQRKAEVEGQINTYNTSRNKMISDFGKEFDVDPKNAKYKLYMNRFQRDVIKSAGFSETKISLIKNEQRLFTARQQLEYTKEGLWWDGVSYNHDGTPLVRPVAGAENMSSAAKAKAKGETGVNPANGIFHDITQNTESNSEARSNKVNEETLLRDNEVIDAELTGKMRVFLEKTAKLGGYSEMLGFKNAPESNPGAAPVISTSPLIEAIQTYNNKSVLDRSDIEKFLKDVGNASSATIKYNGKQLGVTKDQINFFKNVIRNWDAVAEGKLKSSDAPMNVSVSELSGFVNEYQTLNMVKQSNNAYINSVKEQALQGTGLTPAQAERYVYFQGHPERKGKYVPTTYKNPKTGVPIGKDLYIEDPEWTALKRASNIDVREIDKKVKTAFDNASNRQNFYSLYLPKVEELEKFAPGLISKLRSHAVTEYGTDQNITPLSITRTADGKFITEYITGPEKSREKGVVELGPEEAIRLGAQLYPNEPLERLLTYQTSTGDLYTYSPVFEQPIKYSIDRLGNDRNSRTYVPYIHYGGEKIPLFAPDKKGFQGSANAAETLLKHYISNNTARTIDEFIAGAKKLRNL